MSKPRLLDLFCGAGGAAKGYQRAGFYVVGIDSKLQPRYCGDEFVQADAMTFPLNGFNVIHASPPCQAYTRAQRLRARPHPDLIASLRERLQIVDVPWIIENVPGAPLQNPTLLCGAMFELFVYRHRLFETSFELPSITHPEHLKPQIKMGRPVREGDVIQPVGHFSGVAYARRAMGTPWMTREDMREAIPPAYTEWIGRALLKLL